MTRTYKLKPTPKSHPFFARKFYHELRAGIHDAMKVKVAEPQDLIDYSMGEPAIRDQGQIGRCQSFQLRNALMLGEWFANGALPAFDLSPEFAYWAVRSLNGETAVDSGETIGDTLAAFESLGCAEESFMPEDNSYIEKPSDAAFANALTHRYDLQAVPVDYSSFGNICDVLQDRRPLIGGFSVPKSFETCGPDGSLPDPTKEPDEGGHAFSICQAKRSDSWLDDPNSWGTGWGKAGHGFMPASYMSRFFEIWTFIPKSLVQG